VNIPDSCKAGLDRANHLLGRICLLDACPTGRTDSLRIQTLTGVVPPHLSGSVLRQESNMLVRRDGERLLFFRLSSGVMEGEFGLHEKRGSVDG
jgi:hypothetical protein